MSYYPEYSTTQHYPASNTIAFQKKAARQAIFSNLYPSPICVDGVTYNCAEQLYHAIRLNNQKVREDLLRHSPSGILQRSKGYKMQGLERDDWRHIAVDVMRYCILQKYEQCEEFRVALASTKGRLIVKEEAAHRKGPTVWGATYDAATNQYIGRNIMGRILMDIRDKGTLTYTPFRMFVEQHRPNIIEEACSYIGVELADFNLRNDMFARPIHRPVHGIGHIYRTMIGCALLGKLLQKPREGLLAFCGAYIHDLARTNDGADSRHGPDAARYKFPLLNDLWEKYNLTDKERELVCSAVSQHSAREWMKRGDEGYDVMAILKDADALDRCRIGDLKPDFLRYHESRKLINTIAGFCYKTRWQNRDIKFKEFINRCF